GLVRGWYGQIGPWRWWSAWGVSAARSVVIGRLCRLTRQLLAVALAVTAIPLALLFFAAALGQTLQTIHEAETWWELTIMSLMNPMDLLGPILLPPGVCAGLFMLAGHVGRWHWPTPSTVAVKGARAMTTRKAFAQLIILVGLALTLYYGLDYH